MEKGKQKARVAMLVTDKIDFRVSPIMKSDIL